MVRIPRFAFYTAALGAALLLFSWKASAQERTPLQRLPLHDLSALRPAGDNWKIVGGVSAGLDEAGPPLETTPGTGIVANVAPAASGGHLFTPWEHEDLELELEYLMPPGSNSGLYLQGRYEVQLFDSWGEEHPTFADAGGIYQRWDERRGPGREGYEGIPPLQNAIRAPGLWNRLRIVFQAPRFDDEGEKIENARFVLVEHNGVVVQENVEVTGPTRAAAFEDEVSSGPLMIQGDHGPVAFRDIRYKRYGTDLVTLSDVRYRYHEGAFTSTADYAGALPLREGRTEGFDPRVGTGEDKYALTFEGRLEVPVSGSYHFGLDLNWIDDDPHFTGDTLGGGELTVGGKEVFGSEAGGALQGTVTLEEGTHPFTLTYFKNRPWRRPAATFFVEGSGVPFHLLNAPGSTPRPEAVGRIGVEPEREPVLQRSFVWHGGDKRVKAINVGDPTGVHYAFDLARGNLLYVWRGDFLDATPMWHSRGNAQVAEPLSSTVTFSGAPALASLERSSSPWPEAADPEAYAFRSYTLDPARRPTFHYSYDGIEVADRLVPAARGEGRVLRRRLELRGTAAGAAREDLWLRVATGTDITEAGAQRYNIDGRYYIEIAEAGGQSPVVRTRGGGQELLVPVRLRGGEAEISYDIIW